MVINPFCKKNSPFYSENVSVGAKILTDEMKDKHYHKDSEEIFIVILGALLIKLFHKKNIEELSIMPNEILIIKPGIVHQIVKFTPQTEIIIINAPAVLNDKVIVE